MNIKLELTIHETNIILKYLGKGQFDDVAGIIAKIKREGDEQLAAAEALKEAIKTAE